MVLMNPQPGCYLSFSSCFLFGFSAGTAVSGHFSEISMFSRFHLLFLHLHLMQTKVCRIEKPLKRRTLFLFLFNTSLIMQYIRDRSNQEIKSSSLNSILEGSSGYFLQPARRKMRQAAAILWQPDIHKKKQVHLLQKKEKLHIPSGNMELFHL